MMTKPTGKSEVSIVTSRRLFLSKSGAALGGAVVAGVPGDGKLSAATENSVKSPAERPGMDEDPWRRHGSQLHGTPSPFEKGVVKNIAKNLPQYLSAFGRTPLQDLDGIITPNGLFL
jgi:sulfane dehydrogenase subunit SoxC